MRRITVIGTSCSGKSTLSRKLAAVLNLPHIELDALHWEPGWIEVSDDEFRRRVAAVVAVDAWVADGNYSVVRDLVWPAADTIIWLDYSLARVFWQSIKRTCRRVIAKETCCNGNRESLLRSFSRDSILLWVLRSHHPKRKKYNLELPKLQSNGTQVIRFNSPRAMNRWLLEVVSVHSSM